MLLSELFFTEDYCFETKSTGPFNFEQLREPIRLHYQTLRQSGKQIGDIGHKLAVIQTPPTDGVYIVGVQNVKTGMLLCVVKFSLINVFENQYIDIILMHIMSSMVGQYPQLVQYVDNKALTNLLMFMKSHYSLPFIEYSGYQSNDAIRAIKILSRNNVVKWLNVKTGQIIDYDPSKDNPKSGLINEPYRSKTNKTDWRIVVESTGVHEVDDYPIHESYISMVARGFSNIVEDATLQHLRNEIERGFPDTKKRQHATNEVTVTKLQYIPRIESDILQINSSTSSTSGNVYKQLIQANGVNFQPDNSGNTVSVKDSNGTSHSITPVKLNVNNVGVFCECEDYQKRFAEINVSNNCHIGPQPAKYVRKTTTRPPANPLNVPGMCKHLIAVTDRLKNLHIIQP